MPQSCCFLSGERPGIVSMTERAIFIDRGDEERLRFLPRALKRAMCRDSRVSQCRACVSSVVVYSRGAEC